MTVAELFVRCLENEGVCCVFGLPGEETEDLLFALEKSPIQFIPTRHEQGASFMANVWGRLTGQAGVCLSTLGPGATNLITGVADANLDKAPLVAVTAQGSLTRLHHESHQYLDIVNMFRPITKWNTAIADPDVVPEVIRKAFKVAEFEKPGATHIELSEDLAADTAPDNLEPLPRVRVRRPGPDYRAVEQATALLQQARKPLAIAGNGAVRTLASQHLTRLVTQFNVPVTSTFMGKGAVSARLPQSLLSVGLGFKDYVMEALEAADLIVTVGYDIAEYAPEQWNPCADKPIIHIDFVPAEVYAHYAPKVELVCDISGALWELSKRLEQAPPTFDGEWYAPVRQRILDDISGYELEGDEPLHIPGALNIIRELLPDDGLLISDVGSHKVWIARNFPTYCPNGCIISNGLASMGIAVPGAVAASLANPGRKIIAATGDGGFLMNSQELETAQRVGAKFTVIIFNDNDYGLISWKQHLSRGRSVSTQISNPDFKAYVESFGIQAYRPQNAAELRSQLAAALASDSLNVLEIPVDASVNNELVQKLNRHWSRSK